MTAPTAQDTADTTPVNVEGDEGSQEETPETDLATTADSEGEGESTDSVSSPLDGLDDESLQSHPRISKLLRDIEARSAESARQKSEVETARRLQKQQAEFVMRGGVAQATERAIQKALDTGNVRDALDEIQRISNAVYSANTSQNMEAFDAALSGLIPEGATVPAKRAEEIERLRDSVATGRKTPEELMKARVELLRDISIEAKLPELRKQWAADQKKAQQAAAKTQSEREADAARAGQSQPTAVGGKAPGSLTFESLKQMTETQVRELRKTPGGPELIQKALASAR